MNKTRIIIKWTETAKEGLRRLSLKVRQGILSKVDELYACDDPRRPHKPLHGPLKGYYRLTYARYRAIYRVDEETIANGDKIITYTVKIIAVGLRAERSKKDVYQFARKLVELGVLDAQEADDDDDSDDVSESSDER